MKKILFTFLFSLVAIIGNAQIYNTIKYVDKFDDVIRKETIKSKITVHELDSADWFGIKDLSIIEVETKGNEPVKYFSIGKTSFGDENNIEEIADGVYGYQTHYFCVSYKQLIKLNYSQVVELKIHFLNVLLNREELKEDEFIAVDRTVTTQYSGTFLDRLFWIQLTDGSRFIYINTH